MKVQKCGDFIIVHLHENELYRLERQAEPISELIENILSGLLANLTS